MKITLSGLLLACLFAAGCGNSGQKAAYENALKLEQQAPPEQAAAVIAEYEKVIRLEPGTKWAKNARGRIDAVQARIHAQQKTEEVFHQTGVD